MLLKFRWIWDTYFLVILVFTVQKFITLVSPDSQSFLYYFILRSFNPIFYIDYSAHVINLILLAIHCIPFFLYVHRIRFLNSELWRYLFISKCVFAIIGHSFELNYLTALYHISPRLLCVAAIVLILPYVPFYVICYRYAFKPSDKW